MMKWFVQDAGIVSLMCVMASGALVGQAVGVEVTVKNDSFASGGSSNVQAGFVAGESAAAWLTSPCNGQIVAVQVAWLSWLGGTPPTLEDSISIFSAGVFPNPGPIKINTSNNAPAFLDSPVMTDGAMNEFRFIDGQQAIPLQVNVNQGEVFVVSFKFATTPNLFLGPSVITDVGTGCLSGRNALYNLNGGVWQNSCAVGLSGNFVIRAVVQCADSGACCVAGNCMANQTQNACTAQGGTFMGNQTTCNANSCKGACCVPATQQCTQTTQPTCALGNGVFQGIGVTCAQAGCFTMGACCLGPGNCVVTTSLSCIMQSGAFHAGLTCARANCPQPEGACCLGTTCLSGLSPQDCTTVFGGVFLGPNSVCGPTSCTTASCPGDIAPPGGNHMVNTDDLLLVVNSWGLCNQCPADVVPPGGNGMVNTDDLLFILNHWGPCP